MLKTSALAILTAGILFCAANSQAVPLVTWDGVYSRTSVTVGNVTTQDLTTQVNWSPSDPTIATINSNGLATAVATGQVTVTATFGSVSNFATLTVTSAVLTGISLAPSNPSVLVGGTQQFTATGTFSDSSTQTLASVTWTSSDTTIATINNDATNFGNTVGVAPGTISISACAGTVCGSSNLTVIPPPSVSDISPTVAEVGTLVTISGENFGATQGSSTVTFNGVATSIQSWGNERIEQIRHFNLETQRSLESAADAPLERVTVVPWTEVPRDTELRERVRRCAHHVPVGFAAHDDGNQRQR